MKYEITSIIDNDKEPFQFEYEVVFTSSEQKEKVFILFNQNYLWIMDLGKYDEKASSSGIYLAIPLFESLAGGGGLDINNYYLSSKTKAKFILQYPQLTEALNKIPTKE